MRTVQGAGSPILAPLLFAAVVGIAACATAEPSPAMPPTSPPDWVPVSGSSGLRMALPPWLVTFDTMNAIFASEPFQPGATGLQLLAQAPGGVEPQPRPGDDLSRWLSVRLESPVQGTPTFSRVALPAGAAVRLDRVDAARTPNEWRIVAWAIQTPRGVAVLIVDGPSAAWSGRGQDVGLLATLLRVAS